MPDVSLSKKELSVLIHALNTINSRDEKLLEETGVSLSQLYSKLYTLWEKRCGIIRMGYDDL